MITVKKSGRVFELELDISDGDVRLLCTTKNTGKDETENFVWSVIRFKEVGGKLTFHRSYGLSSDLFTVIEATGQLT